MSEIRDNRIKEILRDKAAMFLMQNGNASSLLTVTHVELSGRGKYATIFFTVFPADKEGHLEKTALEFAKRKRSEFKEYVRENSKIGMIPLLDFAIDMGEKNRQRVDELLGRDDTKK